MKLIVSDLDGTLLNSQRQISRENAAALQQAASMGVEIAIATGRSYGNARALCERAGLKPHIISNNGAFVHTDAGERLLAQGVEKKHAREAVRWLL